MVMDLEQVHRDAVSMAMHHEYFLKAEDTLKQEMTRWLRQRRWNQHERIARALAMITAIDAKLNEM